MIGCVDSGEAGFKIASAEVDLTVACGDGAFPSQRKFAGEQLVHAALVHHQRRARAGHPVLLGRFHASHRLGAA